MGEGTREEGENARAVLGPGRSWGAEELCCWLACMVRTGRDLFWTQHGGALVSSSVRLMPRVIVVRLPISGSWHQAWHRCTGAVKNSYTRYGNESNYTMGQVVRDDGSETRGFLAPWRSITSRLKSPGASAYSSWFSDRSTVHPSTTHKR